MLGVLGAIEHIAPFRLDEILRPPVGRYPFDQRGPVAQRAVHDVAVAASADAEIAAPVQRAATRLDAALAKVAAGDVLDRGGRRFLHTEIDPLAGAVTIAGKERTQRLDCAQVS